MALAQVPDMPARGRVRVGALAARLPGSVPPPAMVLAGVVSVQVGAALAKQLFVVAGPVGIVTLRLVFAAALSAALWFPRRRVDRRTLWLILAFGTTLAGMNFFIYQSFSRIPLGMAVTIEFLGPFVVAVAGSRRLLDGVWILLAFGGVVLLTEGGFGGADLTGVAFALAAGACWAGYILLSAAVGRRTTGGQGLTLAMIWGALLVLPISAVESSPVLFGPWVLLGGLAVALLSSVIPYSLELAALRRMSPRVFGVLMSLEPAVAALAGLALLGERLGILQWLAISCVVLASAGATRSGTGDRAGTAKPGR